MSRFWLWMLLRSSFLHFLLILTLDAGGFPSCSSFCDHSSSLRLAHGSSKALLCMAHNREQLGWHTDAAGGFRIKHGWHECHNSGACLRIEGGLDLYCKASHRLAKYRFAVSKFISLKKPLVEQGRISAAPAQTGGGTQQVNTSGSTHTFVYLRQHPKIHVRLAIQLWQGPS